MHYKVFYYARVSSREQNQIESFLNFGAQERETIRKRQKESIDVKAKGKHLGRPRVIKPDNWDEVVEEWRNGKISARQAYTMLGVSKSIFYRWVRM